MRFFASCRVCAIEVLNAMLLVALVVVAVVVCEVPVTPTHTSYAFRGNINNNNNNIHTDYRNEQKSNIRYHTITTKTNSDKTFNMTIIAANWQPPPQSPPQSDNRKNWPKTVDAKRTTKLQPKSPQTTNSAIITTATATTTTTNRNSNSNRHNHSTHKSKGMTSVSATKWFLPTSLSKPFSQLAALFGGGGGGGGGSGGGGGGSGGDLSDYHFLFNAERHTVFQLHTTSTINNNYNNIKRRAAAAAAAATKTTTVRTPAAKRPYPSYRAQKEMQQRSFTNRKTSSGANATTTTATTTSRIIRTPTGIQQRQPVGIAGCDGVDVVAGVCAGVGAEQRAFQFAGNSIGSPVGKDAASSSSQPPQQQPSSPLTVTTSPSATAAGANAVMRMEEVQLYNATSLRQSHFNPFNPTRIIIHGWFGGLHAGVFQSLVPEYMRLGAGNYNVFTVDWGRGAIADYLTASYRVKPVGKALAKFIDFLHAEAGMRFEDLQLIGFSMGAHIAGIAGKHVQTGRVPLIYALDPALPFFRYDAYDERLSIADAAYVEVIHTNAGTYGYDRPLGHVDFYANYGQQQPGCFLNECSHMRAYQLFAESLRRPFRGIGCDVQQWSYMMRYRRCPAPTGLTMYMGGDDKDVLRLRGRGGVYNVETNAMPPYAR